MYKLILSFAFLFSVLFINSCGEDEEVITPKDEPKEEELVNKLLSYKHTINNLQNISKSENIFEYSSNRLIKCTRKTLNGNIFEVFNYIYDNNKLIEIDIQSIEDINIKYNYENNKLISFVGKRGNIIDIFGTYKYENNKITEFTYVEKENGRTIDSNYYYDFIDERYTYFKNFQSYDGEPLKLYSWQKYIYKNGNLIETYLNNNSNKWDLTYRYEFDFAKPSIYTSIKAYQLTLKNFMGLPNDYDKNLLLKMEYIGRQCNGEIYRESTVVLENNYNYLFDEKGLPKNLKTNHTSKCGIEFNHAEEFEYVWE